MKSKLRFCVSMLLMMMFSGLNAQHTGGIGRGDASLMAENQYLYTIIYVKHDASGSNDGSSWADAYTSFQSALNAAVAGDQIWVAGGIYKPEYDYGLNISAPNTARGYHFRMKNGVEIYGGFAGTENSVSQRTDFGLGGANATLLTADLNGDDINTGSS